MAPEPPSDRTPIGEFRLRKGPRPGVRLKRRGECEKAHHRPNPSQANCPRHQAPSHPDCRPVRRYPRWKSPSWRGRSRSGDPASWSKNQAGYPAPPRSRKDGRHRRVDHSDVAGRRLGAKNAGEARRFPGRPSIVGTTCIEPVVRKPSTIARSGPDRVWHRIPGDVRGRIRARRCDLRPSTRLE